MYMAWLISRLTIYTRLWIHRVLPGYYCRSNLLYPKSYSYEIIYNTIPSQFFAFSPFPSQSIPFHSFPIPVPNPVKRVEFVPN